VLFRRFIVGLKVELSIINFINFYTYCIYIVMQPSSLGGAAYCVALCLSVCPSVCPSVPLSLPSVTSFRQPLALRAAYRTAISAAQILVFVNTQNRQRIIRLTLLFFFTLAASYGFVLYLLIFGFA